MRVLLPDLDIISPPIIEHGLHSVTIFFSRRFDKATGGHVFVSLYSYRDGRTDSAVIEPRRTLCKRRNIVGELGLISVRFQLACQAGTSHVLLSWNGRVILFATAPRLPHLIFDLAQLFGFVILRQAQLVGCNVEFIFTHLIILRRTIIFSY